MNRDRSNILNERGVWNHLIDGEWRDPAGGEHFDVEEPSTGKVLARVAAGDREDIDAAVRSARRAYDEDCGGDRRVSEAKSFCKQQTSYARIVRNWLISRPGKLANLWTNRATPIYGQQLILFNTSAVWPTRSMANLYLQAR